MKVVTITSTHCYVYNNCSYDIVSYWIINYKRVMATLEHVLSTSLIQLEIIRNIEV